MKPEGKLQVKRINVSYNSGNFGVNIPILV